MARNPSTLTAMATGLANGMATVAVIDPQVTVSIRPSTILEMAGVTATGVVSVNTGKVSVPTVVTLAGSDKGAELTLPQSSPVTTPPTYEVTIPAGYSSVQFTVTPVVDATPDGPSR